MGWNERLAEVRIRRAQADGSTRDLPGAGQPLPPDALEGLPEEDRFEALLRRTLGGTPEEVDALRLLGDLKAQKVASTDPAERAAIDARIHDLVIGLSAAFERTGRMHLARALSTKGALG